MKKLVFLVIACIFITFFSCNSYKNKNERDTNWDIKAVKYMGTITTYPHGFNENTFWTFYDEHVVLKIRNNDFIENIKKLPTDDGSNFYFLTYAFLYKNYSSIDTIYADHSLKSWKIKGPGKITYYYDSEGIIAEDLRYLYSFFSDCW